MTHSEILRANGCLSLRLRDAERQRFLASLLHADWPAPPNVHASSTLRGPAGNSPPPYQHLNLGVRGGDDLSVVTRNRHDLSCHLGLPAPPCWLHQVHGDIVTRFDSPATWIPYREWERDLHDRLVAGEPQADAAVTGMPGVVLAILTADCLPVLICADDGSEIAAAHAGWRGLSAGVFENTLAAMRTPRKRILAWLGPAIGASSYEVGDEVREAFLADAKLAAESASAFTATRSGHWSCDLYQLARLRLRAAGVTRIFGGGFDTFTDMRLYSYRRDGARSGRMASLIWLSP